MKAALSLGYVPMSLASFGGGFAFQQSSIFVFFGVCPMLMVDSGELSASGMCLKEQGLILVVVSCYT